MSDIDLINRYFARRAFAQAKAVARQRQAQNDTGVPKFRPRLSLMALCVRSAFNAPNIKIGRIIRTDETRSGWLMAVAA